MSDGQFEVRSAAEALAGFAECLGGKPLYDQKRARTLLVLEEVDLPTHTRIHLHFGYTGQSPLCAAYLLLPKSALADGRAMLCLHQTTKFGKDEPAGLGRDANLAYALELVELGFVCICPDYPTFGEFHPDLTDVSGTRLAIEMNFLAVDILAERPEVDASRIGCIGHSLGGHNSIFTAVWEQRIKAVVSCCGFTDFASYYKGELKGWAQGRYMPRVSSSYGNDPKQMPFDFPDLIAALCPRAFLAVAPIHDDNFEISGVRKTFQRVKPIYQAAGAEAQLNASYPEAAHSFPQAEREAAYKFLMNNL